MEGERAGSSRRQSQLAAGDQPCHHHNRRFIYSAVFIKIQAPAPARCPVLCAVDKKDAPVPPPRARRAGGARGGLQGAVSPTSGARAAAAPRDSHSIRIRASCFVLYRRPSSAHSRPLSAVGRAASLAPLAVRFGTGLAAFKHPKITWLSTAFPFVLPLRAPRCLPPPPAHPNPAQTLLNLF
jgi:hypothetical protein